MDYLTSIRQKTAAIIRKNMTTWNERPEKFFLALMIPFGLIFTFVMPPFMVPDENAHLYRAYQISEGHLTSVTQNGITGAILPLDLKRNLDIMYTDVINGGPTAHVQYKHFLTEKVDTNDRGFIQFDTTSVYSPMSYIPQAIGVGLARITYPSELAILYIGRLFNLAAFILIVYAAIRLTPVKKWVFIVVALFPMTIQQAASMSSDVTNIGIVMLAIALVLRMATLKKLPRNYVIAALVVALVLGLTKQTNGLAIIPFFFLPTQLFGTLKRRIWFCLGMLGTALGAVIVWYMLTKLLHYNFSYSGNPLVDTAGQIQFLLSHPLSYFKVIFNTFIFNTTTVPPQPDFYIQSMVGVFSWIRYQLPLLGILLALGTLGLALLTKTKSDSTTAEKILNKNRWLKLSLPVTLILSVLAVGTVLYLMWTPVGGPSISGIQGRYFIPLLPLLIPLFLSERVRLVFKNPFTLLWAILLVSTFNFAMATFQTALYFNVGGILG